MLRTGSTLRHTGESDFKKLKKLAGGLLGGSDGAAKRLQQEALRAQQAAERSRLEAIQTQENIRVNMAQNLTNSEAGTVVAGGTADVEALAEDSTRRKRNTGDGLYSQLGLS